MNAKPMTVGDQQADREDYAEKLLAKSDAVGTSGIYEANARMIRAMLAFSPRSDKLLHLAKVCEARAVRTRNTVYPIADEPDYPGLDGDTQAPFTYEGSAIDG